MITTFSWGTLNFLFSGPDGITRLLAEEFKDRRVFREGDHYDIRVNMTRSRRNIDQIYEDPPVATTGPKYYTLFRVKSRIVYIHCVTDGSLFNVNVVVKDTPKRALARYIPIAAQRVLNSEYASLDELQFKTLLYKVLIPVTQLILIRRGLSFIHSSSLSLQRDDSAVLFAGAGGVGKTSLSSYLIYTDEVNCLFMADDLSIVSKERGSYLNPIGVHVYPYNVFRNESLRRAALANRKLFDKLHWALRSRLVGKDKVLRRISPATLYRDQTLHPNDRVDVGAAFFISRYSGPAKYGIMSKSSFSSRCADILRHEFEGTFLMNSDKSYEVEVSTDSVIDHCFDMMECIVTGAISSANTYEIRIPHEWTPDDLGRYITQTGLVSTNSLN